MDGKSSKTYVTHRQNQRERILEVAEALFIRQGIEQVSLSAIARSARLTRKTVYEYFPNKQEVAWAILQKIFSRSMAEFPEAAQGSGLQRIEGFMLWMSNLLENHPDDARFIVEFNSLYAREAASERMRQVTGRSQGRDPVLGFIESGMADGSLRPDLDPALASAAIWNLVSGMNARFGLLGNLIEGEYGQPVRSIYQEICRIFLDGIRAEEV